MGARKVAVALLVLASTCGAALLACDDSGSNAVKEQNPAKDSGAQPGIDGGAQTTSDGGPLSDGAASDCFVNPQTHFEIINACTDAVRIAKNPTLPLLYPDGGLPPLP